MCGLSGFSLAPGEAVNSRILATALLLGIEHRGKDATGAAWRDAYNNIVIQKHPVDATRYVKRLSIPRSARVAVLHTRFATQGSHFNNGNNHPIRVGSIVGAHNGVLYNDYDLFHDMKMERLAQVDSEAIFAGLHYGDQAKHTEFLGKLEGSAAVAWMDELEDADTLHVSRVEQSPVCWAQSEHGSFVFASTFEAVDTAMDAARMKIAHADVLDNGHYFRVKAGMVAESVQFCTAPPRRGFGWAGNWNWKDDYEDWTPPSKDTTAIGTPLGASSLSPEGRATPLVFTDDDEATTSYLIDDLNPRVPVNGMSVDAHYSEYRVREAAIDYWMDGMKADDRAVVTTACQLKAFTRVGDWVTTQLNGEDRFGQVYELPQTFPHGWYALMLRVPTECSSHGGDLENVLVRRMAPDFDLVTKAESPTEVSRALAVVCNA